VSTAGVDREVIRRESRCNRATKFARDDSSFGRTTADDILESRCKVLDKVAGIVLTLERGFVNG
jgi:hypothetical protein